MAGNATAQEKLFALREQIARLEGRPVPALAAAGQLAVAKNPEIVQGKDDGACLPFGIADLDKALEGGLPADGITEFRSRFSRDAGAVSGVALAIAASLQRQEETEKPALSPILWIGDGVSTQEAGLPYAIGFMQFGLRPEVLLHAAPKKLEEALWLAETAISNGAFGLVILEISGNPAHFGLVESRRLALRAKAAGRPLLLLRHAGEEEASSAVFRFLAEPAPASGRRLPDGSMLGGSIGHSSFRLTLEKSRNPAPLSFLLEWNPHDRQFFPIGRTGIPAPSRDKTTHSVSGLPALADGSHRPAKMGPVLAFERAS